MRDTRRVPAMMQTLAAMVYAQHLDGMAPAAAMLATQAELRREPGAAADWLGGRATWGAADAKLLTRALERYGLPLPPARRPRQKEYHAALLHVWRRVALLGPDGQPAHSLEDFTAGRIGWDQLGREEVALLRREMQPGGLYALALPLLRAAADAAPPGRSAAAMRIAERRLAKRFNGGADDYSRGGGTRGARPEPTADITGAAVADTGNRRRGRGGGKQHIATDDDVERIMAILRR
jgi:hypothetical protein